MRDIPEDLKAVELPQGYYFDFTDPLTHMATTNCSWAVAVYRKVDLPFASNIRSSAFRFVVIKAQAPHDTYAASIVAGVWVLNDDLQELVTVMCAKDRIGVK